MLSLRKRLISFVLLFSTLATFCCTMKVFVLVIVEQPISTSSCGKLRYCFAYKNKLFLMCVFRYFCLLRLCMYFYFQNLWSIIDFFSYFFFHALPDTFEFVFVGEELFSTHGQVCKYVYLILLFPRFLFIFFYFFRSIFLNICNYKNRTNTFRNRLFVIFLVCMKISFVIRLQ